MSDDFLVLGAGSVGVGTAIHLQQRGFSVRLLDRKLPASATSFGNAGVINNSSFLPLNNPGLLRKLPRLLSNKRPELRYNLRHVAANLPWCFNFLRATSRQATLETAEALAALVRGALDEHKAIMQRVGNMHRLSESGWLKVYRREVSSFFTSMDQQLFDDNNIAIRKLDANEITELEPSLKPIFSSGYLLSESASVNNPGALVKEYVESFVAAGGVFTQAETQQLSFTDGRYVLATSDGEFSAKQLVVAAGPWSGTLLEQLGYRVMLGVERGYHQHFNLKQGAAIHRPVHDVDAGYIFAPMELGLRLTTGVELNHRDAAPDYSQLQQVIPRLHEAVPVEGPTDDPIWMGCRPTFPDSRPVIDRAPDHDGLWLAFGHQHIGLMSGPVTGKLLVQKICGEATDIDLQPFRAARWIK